MMWKTGNDGGRQKKVFHVQSDMDFVFFKNLSQLILERFTPLPHLYWVYDTTEGQGMMSSSTGKDYKERTCSFQAAAGREGGQSNEAMIWKL